jgi:hypothetical protein
MFEISTTRIPSYTNLPVDSSLEPKHVGEYIL